jgi:hypothetical protein
VIVGFGDRIAMDETLDGAMARVFGALVPQAATAAAPSPSAEPAGSLKALLDDAASVLARAGEELRHLQELLRQLREAEERLGARGSPRSPAGTPR